MRTAHAFCPPHPFLERMVRILLEGSHVGQQQHSQSEMKVVQDQALKDMLQNTVRPMVVMHLQSAQAIQTRIGFPAS